MSLARTMRTLTIMGRSEKEEKIDLAKLLYPPMQAVDIHSLDLDIVHAGMDQRKIHMLVRELFPKMGWKVPVAVHHRLIPGLTQPTETDDSKALGKMSKSNPNSGVFIHDTDDEIRTKIKKAWCEEGNIEANPLLEISKHVIFHEFSEMNVERPEKFGGNVSFSDYSQLESDFATKKLHPSDLKQTVAENLVKIVGPIRDKISLDGELSDLIKNSA
jgi:tyrosyl-tRNA synthetase